MIYDSNSIDIMAKRNDGGLDLFIISSGAIDTSETTQKLLIDKVGMYLGYIGSQEFKQEFSDIDKGRVSIIFELEDQIPDLLRKLCDKIVPWAEENGANFVVKFNKAE